MPHLDKIHVEAREYRDTPHSRKIPYLGGAFDTLEHVSVVQSKLWCENRDAHHSRKIPYRSNAIALVSG